jgi:hypothetical protein
MANKSTSQQQQEHNQGTQPPSPAQQEAPPLLDQLSQLDALHQQGALTDSEFTAAKAKLLALRQGPSDWTAWPDERCLFRAGIPRGTEPEAARR